jgi:hypothetical protein
MGEESAAERGKRLEAMQDRLVQQATEETLPDEGDDDAMLYANVAVQLAANRISVKIALNDKDTNRSKKASDAIDLEINGLVAMGFGVPEHYGKMTALEKQAIIHAFMFMTEKKLGSGAFDKWKARLVAGGNELKDVIKADTYSPTANYSSVMTTVALAASERKEARSYDVKTAYLIPDVEPGEKSTFIWIDSVVAARFVELHPCDLTTKQNNRSGGLSGLLITRDL